MDYSASLIQAAPPPVPPTRDAPPPPPLPSDATASLDRVSPSLSSSFPVAGPSRPPLQRATTGGSLGGTASGGGAVGASGCRLLWRGKVVTPEGRNLHGIAIIAHLFTLSSSSSSSASPHLAQATPPSLNPFDDPFASASSVTASGADMCLGLEMLRGADIRVKTSLENERGEVSVRRKGESPAPALAKKGSVGRKGKGKKREEREELEVETPTDVRVYVDERCEETVEWFEDLFCREGREGAGVRLDAGGEEVVIFASYPPASTINPQEQENVDPSTSTSLPPRPPLTLLLGRPSKSATRKPRPDDPLPRENLFTKKLRKTASLPTSSFSRTGSSSKLSLHNNANDDDPFLAPAPPPPSTAKPPRAKRQTAKDKAIASLLGSTSSNAGENSAASRLQRKSSLPPAQAFPPPPPPQQLSRGSGSGSGLSRSASSSRLFPSRPLAATSHGRESSLPPPPVGGGGSAPSSRRNSLAAAGGGGSAAAAAAGAGAGRAFQRTRSRSSMLLDSPPSSDAEAEDDEEEEDMIATLPVPSIGGSGSGGGGGFLHPFSAAATGGGRTSRAPSPTPSVASTSFPAEDEDNFGAEESHDAVAELRSFSRSGAGGRNGGGGMARSSSLPVGQFVLGSGGGGGGGGVEGEKARKRRRMEEREKEVKPVVAPSRAGSVGPGSLSAAAAGEVGEVELRNKNTVKKVIAARLGALNVGKDHPDYRDLFSYTSRGVGFAMRDTFKSTLLTPPDRLRAEHLTEQHLRMYLPPSSFPTPVPVPLSYGADPAAAAGFNPSSALPTPTPEPTLPRAAGLLPSTTAAAGAHPVQSVKMEPLDDPAAALATEAKTPPPSLPSPKSLGDVITVKAGGAGEDDDEDVEMEMTQEA
ncbi:hypothetical protein JCM6882_005623 [Rhodosporidiobolus microsporus]